MATGGGWTDDQHVMDAMDAIDNRWFSNGYISGFGDSDGEDEDPLADVRSRAPAESHR